MAKPKQDEKKVEKKKDESARSPKGGLPRKNRGKTTDGYETVDGVRVRRVPSKRIKGAHRKQKEGGAVLSLRKFARKLDDESLVRDWLANKASTGQ